MDLLIELFSLGVTAEALRPAANIDWRSQKCQVTGFRPKLKQ